MIAQGLSYKGLYLMIYIVMKIHKLKIINVYRPLIILIILQNKKVIINVLQFCNLNEHYQIRNRFIII